MAISKLIDGLPQRTMTQEAFDAAVAKLMADLPVWGGEVNATAANLNAIAAGGAFAIPYTWKSSAGYVVGIGSLATDPGALYVDNTSVAGKNVTAQLAEMSTSSSTVKGYFRICKVNDPGTFSVYSIATRTANAGYSTFGVTLINSFGGFAVGDSVILYFTPNGNPGIYTPGYFKVSDQKASGASGGAAIQGVQVRTLNAVEHNTISGASLASNRITLPAGEYLIWGRVPATNVTGHQGQFWNFTDGTYVIAGSTACSAQSSGSVTDSTLSGRMVIAASKTFELRHFIQNVAGAGASLGLNASPGAPSVEVFSEITFTKVA